MRTRRLQCCVCLLILTLLLSVLPVSAQEVPTGMEEAAVTLREGLKNREESIQVIFRIDPDSFDGTQDSAIKLADQITALAYAHTGVPDEGDYLRHSIWFIQPTVHYARLSDCWQFTISYYMRYFANAPQEAELDPLIEDLVEELELKRDLTDYQKVSAIYNYICGSVAYDYETLEDDSYGLKWSAYAAVVNKTAVCQGYATLFYRLCLEAGIDNRVITGMSVNPSGEPERHAWNLVKLDGAYYYLDTTWDAGAYQYQWFLKTAAEFTDHEPDPEFMTEEFHWAYPLSELFYQHPFVPNGVEGDFEYQVTNGAAALISYKGDDRDVTVPAQLGGYPVRWIGQLAFFQNNYIESLTFSEGIRVMESEAILECKNLKAIHLPSTIDFTASKEPDFPCRLVCGASRCPSVETITVAEENPYLTVLDGVLYTKDMTILRYYPTGDPREYFEIPEGVLAISANAFAYSSHLKEVRMPDTVLRLQFGCFNNCTSLEKINISTSCGFIDQYNFDGTALESIHIPASVVSLYSGSFGIDCRLKTITVDPENPVYYVEDNVLYGRYSEEFNLDSCHCPGAWLVKYPAERNAASFTVPEGVVGIEQHAFDNSTSLKEIKLPDSLQVLFTGAFSGCSGLTNVEIPEKLTHIYSQAFYGCANLTELVIPANVQFLGDTLLSPEHSLENVIFLGDAPEMDEYTIDYPPMKVYYPAGNSTWNSVIQMYAEKSEIQWIEACRTHQFESMTRGVSCTRTGFSGQKCTVCGLVVGCEDLVFPTGHDLVLDQVFPPSCEGVGFTQYQCVICQEYVSEDYTDPTGHSYDENGVCVNCIPNEEPEYIDRGTMSEEETIFVVYLMLFLILLFILVVVIVWAVTRRKKKEA